MRSTLSRTIAKTILWKTLGITTLILVGIAFGVPLYQVGGVTIIYHAVMLLLYIAHERFWDKITWGRKNNPEPPVPLVDTD